MNKAQDELLQNIYQQVGSDWYDVMEALAKGRPGFDFIKHLKDEKASIRNVKIFAFLNLKICRKVYNKTYNLIELSFNTS